MFAIGILLTWYAWIGETFQVLYFDGVFLPSDSAVKQILLTLDERPGQSFIIEDLDEFHVLVRADEEQRVKRELEAEVRSPLRPAESFFLTEMRAAGEEYVQYGSLDVIGVGKKCLVIGARW
jgi:TFIIH basal transcription factor complex TTD-A subunit